MSVFIDTSAFLAVLDADDEVHEEAKKTWEHLITTNELMRCSNYVLLETFALVQRRLGMEAVRTFQQDIFPLLRIEWVNDVMHSTGIVALLSEFRRGLSLVDCVSFEIMRGLGMKRVFCFDQHFDEKGFERVIIEE